jgi:hypothetical protein
MNLLRDLLKAYKPIDDRLIMVAMDEEILGAIPAQTNLAPMIPYLDSFDESTRCHLLFLLATREQKEVLEKLKEIAFQSKNYLNVAEALAGLLKCGEDHREKCFERLRPYLPPDRDQHARFLRDIQSFICA